MKNLEKKLLIVAIVGKSGVGKTVIKNLITKTSLIIILMVHLFD